MLHAGILMSVLLPGMVIVGQIGLLITELMEERMHAREMAVAKVKAHAWCAGRFGGYRIEYGT